MGIKQLFSTDVKPHPSPKVRAAAAVALLGLAALAMWLTVSAPVRQPGGVVGLDSAATAHELGRVASKLVAADQIGDRQQAASLFDPLTALLQTMNDRQDTESSTMRGCRLAAQQLVVGVDAVYQGARWSDRSRFDAALSLCR